MFWEFEDAKDSKNTDEDERSSSFGSFAVSFCLLYSKYNEIRNNSQHVEYIHHVLTEMSLAWTRDSSKNELGREPDDADRLNDEEWVSIVGYLMVCQTVFTGDIDAECPVEHW